MQGFRRFSQVIVLKTKQDAARKELRFINQTRKRHFDKPSYMYLYICIYMYVCLCIFIYITMYVCIYICIYEHTHTNKKICHILFSLLTPTSFRIPTFWGLGSRSFMDESLAQNDQLWLTANGGV